MLKKLKSLISSMRFDGEYYHTKCDCGGNFKQIYYIETLGGIDEEIFVDLFICRCDKCKKQKILDFQVET